MDIQVQERIVLGKQVKSLRKAGLVPAELFGAGVSNIHLSVSAKDFTTLYREAGENTVVYLHLSNNKKIPVLISDVTRDAFTQAFLSVDFHQVQMDKKINAEVPIEFTDIAPALKNGFLVVTVLAKIEVEALPSDIPRRFDVSLLTLAEPGQSVAVKDLSIPPGVKVLVPQETVIVTVTEKAKEEEKAPESVATPEAVVGAATEAAQAAPAQGK